MAQYRGFVFKQVAVGGVAEIHGQAGSAAIFNVSLLHTVSENEFSVHFLYRNDHFTKTGSGQNIGKPQKEHIFSGDDPPDNERAEEYTGLLRETGTRAAG
jgi:hypothetical protein